jgi:NAD(P)-dependent dehydrogenase (short-subunit alcohol dehydrogenase family)
MRGLDKTVALVTGAASGIGRATAIRLSEEGATVVAVDRTPAIDADGPSIDHTVDITDESAVAALVADIVSTHGRLDSVVNAAGVAGGGPVHLLDLAEWQRVIDINLTGTFLVAKHVLGPMIDQGKGSIVNLASIEGLEGTEGGSAYNASKGGVVILTKNLAIDYGAKGIRANCICPGFIDTPMMDSVLGDPAMKVYRDKIVHEHKLNRFGQAAEIAAAATFLASDDASFVTGHALVVDGGYTAGRRQGVLEAFGL